MNKELKEKLLEAISFIENTAQNQETEDNIPANEWSFLESDARELREVIEDLETEKEYEERTGI